MTSASSTHRTGYFERPAEAWDLVEFLDFMIEHYPAMPNRCILNRWVRTLERIAKCRSSRHCCHGSDRFRASRLNTAHRSRGSTSRRIASNYLRDTRPPTAALPLITTNITYTNNNNNNNNNSTVATNHGTIGDVCLSRGDAAFDVTSSKTPRQSDTAATHPSDDESACDSLFSTRSGRVWASFHKTFRALDDELKWKLPSGTTVEDTIYETVLQRDLPIPVESMLQNWIIDVENPRIQSLFSKTDWAVIEARVPPSLVGNVELDPFLARFGEAKDMNDLENMILALIDPVRDPKLRFDMRWARSAVDQFLRLWQSESRPLASDHLEDWYSNNIWSRLLDDCLLALPNVHFERKEVVCQSSSLRRNRQRDDPTERQKTGPRLDGLLRGSDDGSHEFCAVEAAPSLRCGPSSTKWLTDKAKLVMILRDMLNRLMMLSEHDAMITQQLQVVGISFAGRMMQPMRLCHGQGHVTLLVSEPVMTAPSDFGQLRDLLDLLSSILGLRSVLKTTIDVFRGRAGNGLRVGGIDATKERIPRQPCSADGC